MKAKKILSLLLALTMVLTMIPAFAEEATTPAVGDEWYAIWQKDTEEHECSFPVEPTTDSISKYFLSGEDMEAGKYYMVADLEKDATCTETGVELKVWKCTTTGCASRMYKVVEVAIDENAHNFGNDVVELPADQQTKEGYTLYAKQCADCGDFDTEITEIKNPETDKVWTRDYLIECIQGAKCPWCGKVATFNYSMAEVSCEQDFEVTVICSDPYCLSKETPSKIEFKKGEHIWEETQVSTPSTSCAVEGNITYKVLCAICGDINRTFEEDTAVLTHIMWKDSMDRFGLSVGADGYLVGGSNVAAQDAVDMFNMLKKDTLNEHDNNWEGNKYAYDAKHLSVALTPATCTEDGSIVLTCDVTGCKQGLTIKIKKLGHDFDMENALVIPATCETDGIKVAMCTRCDEMDITVVQAATEHSYDHKRAAYIQNGKIYEELALGQVPNGIVECQPYDKVLLCDRYGLETSLASNNVFFVPWMNAYVLEDLKEKIAEMNADLDLTKYLSIQAGNLVYICEGMMYVDKGITTWNHTDADFATNRSKSTVLYENVATCVDPYELMVKCNDCDHVAKVTKDALGHDWANDGEVIKAATCTEKGETKVTCRRPGCNATTVITTPAAGHLTAGNDFFDPAPSCFTPGVKVEYCTRCKTEVSRTPVAAAHKIGNVTKIENAEVVYTNGVATGFKTINCTDDGYAEYWCTVCSQKQTVDVLAPGHVFIFDDIIDKNLTDDNRGWHKNVIEVAPATCLNDGYITVKCENCEEQSTKITDPAFGHFAEGHCSWEAKDIIPGFEPTCIKTGMALVTCECGRKAEREIPTVDHTLALEGNLLVCTTPGCDYTEKFDFDVQYEVSMLNATIESTKTSGVGHITLVKGKMDAPLYARINFGYTLDNGEPVAYVANVEIDEHGDFRMASPTCPYGASLTNIFVTITTAPGAQDMVINDVPNLGYLTIR